MAISQESPGASVVPNRGYDLPIEKRPGVPMETKPSPVPGVHWVTPPYQEPTTHVTKRMELAGLPPVFGTAQPPRGVSGVLRRLAYNVPEHRPRHWALLFLADRVDVLEHGAGRKWLVPATIAIAAVALRGAPALSSRRRRR